MMGRHSGDGGDNGWKPVPITHTSENNPLRIAEVRPRPDYGRIGITPCPGKKDAHGMSGRHDRNLTVDLDAVRDWGAAAVVSLITDDEFELLSVGDLGDEARARHMTWLHLPIRDGHPPPEDTFECAWKHAGPYLRSLLRSRFDVLVHCRGGLGRAGTVAARLLVELGARPADAIRDVRHVRPGAIETTGQERHVEGCRPADEGEPSRDVESIRDRALGAFIGLAVGDAVGTTLEFERRDARPPLADMVGGGPFGLESGQWTDDTSMALALAESLALASSESLDARDLMDRFVDWREGEDYGAPGIAGILAGSWCGKPRCAIESGGYVVHTLEAAIWSVARTRNFRDAVLLAANLADDADTTAAVAGQLAGALYGLSGIPRDWLARLAWRERLLAAAKRLLT